MSDFKTLYRSYATGRTSGLLTSLVTGLLLLPSLIYRLVVWFKARFISPKLLARTPQFNADHLAAVIFSSGSTGEPKGVMLSHHNILSNVEGMQMMLHVDDRDNLCAALPFCALPVSPDYPVSI